MKQKNVERSAPPDNGSSDRASGGKPSFFIGLRNGILNNLPLLAAGGLLLLFALILEVRVLRFLSYSLFLSYFLSCSFQAIYGISSKSYLRANEGDGDRDQEKSKEENGR